MANIVKIEEDIFDVADFDEEFNHSMDEHIRSNSTDDETAEYQEEIQNVLKEIEAVDKLLRELNERKLTLVTKYNKLKEEKLLQKSSHLANKNWELESFPWLTEVRETLKNVFKIDYFRAQQLKSINAILSKHDVLLLAPTGGGKSLCFQLPAVVQKGVSVIVSPLLSLMEDQVWSLKKLGIEAELLCSSTEKNTKNLIHNSLSDKSDVCTLKLLYVTPELMAKSKRFMTALQKSYFSKKLNMIAIDEVHCCSQWGHDFRTDYKYLGSLKTMFPDVPILGVTATATTKVIVDVQKMLNIRGCLVLKAPFNRPNLYYHVLEKPSEKEEIYKLFTQLLTKRYAKKSGIIYTFSIKDAEDLSAELIKRGANVRPYHAMLDYDSRTRIHSKWLKGRIQAVVATVAFGMGIDKPDVRFVIHHTISKSMENFYQESGRAGRDGERAECILLYRFSDISKITSMMFTERTGLKNAYSMISYCSNGTRCRRDIISKHFAEVWNESDCNKMCDRCYYINRIQPPEMNIVKHCLDLHKIIDYVGNLDMKITSNKLIESWFHKGATNLRLLAVKPPSIDRYCAEQIIAYLIIDGYLREDFHYTSYTTISYIKTGSKTPNIDIPIPFVGARIFKLPPYNNVCDDAVVCVDKASSKQNEANSSKSLSDSISSVNGSHKRLTKKCSSSNNKSHNRIENDCTPISSKISRKISENLFLKTNSLSINKKVSQIVLNETKRRKLIAKPGLRKQLTEKYDEDVSDDLLVVEDNYDVICIDD